MTIHDTASQLAELVRQLNHATQRPKGEIEYPGDIYDVVGSLHLTAQRTPQLYRQLLDRLADLIDTGNVTDPNSSEGVTSYDATHAALINAAAAMETATQHLAEAHSSLSYLGWEEDRHAH